MDRTWQRDKDGTKRFDALHRYGIQEATAAALQTLLLHYPQIVYLGYVFWRKCLIRVWLTGVCDTSLPLLQWAPDKPSTTLGGVPPAHLGMQGSLDEWWRQAKLSRLEPTSFSSTSTSVQHFGQFLTGLFLANQSDIVVTVLAEQLKVDLVSKEWQFYRDSPFPADVRGQGEICGTTVLHRAIRKAPNQSLIPRKLLEKCCGGGKTREVVVEMADEPGGITLLAEAAGNGSLAVVQFLIAQGADLEVKDDVSRWTPLHRAVHYGHILVVKLLVVHGAKVEARDDSQQTPLQRACWDGRAEIVDFLLKEGQANVEAADQDGCTSLHLAVEAGGNVGLTVIRCLVEFGANINATTCDGDTPLHKAANNDESNVQDQVAVVKYLLLHGANPYTVNDDGDLPYDVAISTEVAAELNTTSGQANQ